jgi:hypothetical protein
MNIKILKIATRISMAIICLVSLVYFTLNSRFDLAILTLIILYYLAIASRENRG